jgi:hypothetical protein
VFEDVCRRCSQGERWPTTDFMSRLGCTTFRSEHGRRDDTQVCFEQICILVVNILSISKLAMFPYRSTRHVVLIRVISCFIRDTLFRRSSGNPEVSGLLLAVMYGSLHVISCFCWKVGKCWKVGVSENGSWFPGKRCCIGEFSMLCRLFLSVRAINSCKPLRIDGLALSTSFWSVWMV